MGRRVKKAGFEDDGRVIAPMNIDGMPWYRPRNEGSGIRGKGSEVASLGSEIDALKSEYSTAAQPELPILTRRERIAFTFGVMKAALLVSLVFIGALFAFILFCTEVWFR